MDTTATELSKTVIETTLAGKADDAFADQIADSFSKLDDKDAYFFVVQVAHGMRDTPEHKSALAAFNLLLSKRPKFCETMDRVAKHKAAVSPTTVAKEQL